jgi:hypothetical protein
MGRGKYAEIIDDLPRLKAENPTYQNKVNDRKKEILEEIGDALSSSSLALLYRQQRQEKEEIEAQLSLANLDLEAITQLLTDRYEIDEISSVSLDDGDTVRVDLEPYAKIEDAQKLWDWAKANDMERSMQLPWQTVNSMMKEMLLQGMNEPDGVVAYQRPKIVFTRAKKVAAAE